MFADNVDKTRATTFLLLERYKHMFYNQHIVDVIDAYLCWAAANHFKAKYPQQTSWCYETGQYAQFVYQWSITKCKAIDGVCLKMKQCKLNML